MREMAVVVSNRALRVFGLELPGVAYSGHHAEALGQGKRGWPALPVCCRPLIGELTTAGRDPVGSRVMNTGWLWVDCPVDQLAGRGWSADIAEALCLVSPKPPWVGAPPVQLIFPVPRDRESGHLAS